MWLHEATLEGMEEVGLRELKNRLSVYVNRVKAGHAIIVTDRGEPVAEIRPVSAGASSFRRLSLDDLVRTGLLITGKPNDPKVYPLLTRIGRSSSSQLLDEQRGAR